MTLFEKSLRTLELGSVLELLAQEAGSAGAKERALAIEPSTDIYEVRALLEETGAAKKMMELKGSPGFGGVRDVVSSVRRADRGGMLNTVELMDIAALLRCAASAEAYGGTDGEPTAVSRLFSALYVNKYLESRISTSIIGVDEIADSASSELSDIRRHMRIAGDKVRQSLNKIITSPAYSKYLQEPIITMKNDRFVVPVKAEHKSAVPGLVHDISSSGATLFIEPMSAVQANNEIRELLAREKREIERILMELSAEVAGFGDDIVTDYEVLTELDLIFAKAKLSYKLNAAAPEISEDGSAVLKAARHPLLPAGTAVPIDIAVGVDYDTLVITGPNTGGKTVALKTLGLLCAMAQCGLHIPVRDGSRVPVFRMILADIGDEQSIEQSLSTFSSHMTNIVSILKECGERTLLLFDELGAGTDPVEGAALAIAVIEHARSLGAVIAATTHYAELKMYATTTPGVQNASCEFDVETLKPTYKLLTGIPGKSNAFAISARLGLDESIIDDARRRIDEDSASFEEVIGQLEAKRQEMEREELEARRALQSAAEDAKRAEQYRQELEREREKAAQQARREAAKILEDARRTADRTFDELNELRRAAKNSADWQQINTKKTEILHGINETEEGLRTAEEEEEIPPQTRPVRPGDRVKLLSLGTLADVIDVSPDRVLTLQAGIMKITAREDEVRIVEDAETVRRAAVRTVQKQEKKLAASVKPEVDVRGMMSDEAVLTVERYLDAACMAKLNTVTVIHGKGTGALRKAVQAYLKTDPHVKSFRLGKYGEGEDGVTVVELK